MHTKFLGGPLDILVAKAAKCMQTDAGSCQEALLCRSCVALHVRSTRFKWPELVVNHFLEGSASVLGSTRVFSTSAVKSAELFDGMYQVSIIG